MSAPLLATLCLVFGCGSAFAEPELAVYLKGSQPQTPGVNRYMKQELAALMHSAGYRIEWSASSNSEMLAVVQLSGDCSPADFSLAEGTRASGTTLASTVVTDGRVLPFATVNCAAITRSVAGVLVNAAPAQREFFYGRALARVIAHELFHIVMGSGDHTRNGVSRSCFSASDLLTERFEFEGVALAQMRRHAEPAVLADTDDASDR